jgi:hypothetical protein
MPSISLNNIVFTGKMNVVPKIMGATFSVSQVDRQSRDGANELFGVGVGASTDTMVVGAYGVDTPSTDFGLVHLYSAVSSNWNYVQDLTLTSAQLTKLTGATPHFGQSVSVSGDWAAVSAPGVGSSFLGTVYLYRRVAGVWGTTPFQELSPSDTSYTTGGNFGYSVAMDGTTLVVGHRDTNNNHGAAHVFVFNGTTWSLQTSLLPTSMRANNTNGQRIGWSVAISGNTVIAGGPGAASGVGLGNALVSTRTGSTWSAVSMLNPNPADATADGFGAGVAVRGNKFVVGAPGKNAVHVFTGTTQSARLTVASSGTPTITDTTVAISTNTRMGWCVDANADCSVVFAGAPTQPSNSGAVYVFENVGGTWGPSAINNAGVSKLLPTPAVSGQRFGWNVNWLSNSEVIVGGTGQTGVVGSVYSFK